MVQLGSGRPPFRPPMRVSPPILSAPCKHWVVKEQDLTSLSSPADPVTNKESQEPETEKVSESDPILQVAADRDEKTLVEEESDRQTDVNG